MANNKYELELKVAANVADVRRASAEIRDFKGVIKGASKTLLSFGGVFAGVFGAKEALGAFAKQEEAITSLNAAIRAANMPVEEYSKKFQKLANDIQRITTYSDDVILKNTQLALSMGVSEKNIDSVMKGALGLASTYNVTLSEAIKKLARAQNGNFESMQDLIPALKGVKSEAEKTAILNKALSDSYAVAKANAETFSGAMQQAQNILNDVGVEVGKRFAPAIISAAKCIKNFAQWFLDLSDAQKTMIMTTSAAVAVMPAIIKSVMGMTRAWQAYKLATDGATFATNKFKYALVKTGIGAAIVALGLAVGYIIEKWDEWTGKNTIVQKSAESTSDAIDNLSLKIEKQVEVVEKSEDALTQYQKALEALDKIQKEHAYSIADARAKLNILNAEYAEAAERVKILTLEAKDYKKSMEERAYAQQELVNWTSKLNALDAKRRQVSQGIAEENRSVMLAKQKASEYLKTWNTALQIAQATKNGNAEELEHLNRQKRINDYAKSYVDALRETCKDKESLRKLETDALEKAARRVDLEESITKQLKEQEAQKNKLSKAEEYFYRIKIAQAKLRGDNEGVKRLEDARDTDREIKSLTNSGFSEEQARKMVFSTRATERLAATQEQGGMSAASPRKGIGVDASEWLGSSDRPKRPTPPKRTTPPKRPAWRQRQIDEGATPASPQKGNMWISNPANSAGGDVSKQDVSKEIAESMKSFVSITSELKNLLKSIDNTNKQIATKK